MRDQRPALVFWWMSLAATMVFLRLLSTGIPESGDGVMHHLIARYAWQHPHLLLDHWGKPLFTLLASPFAQLGLWGMALFNALCFVATCWTADLILKDRSSMARWLFAPMLLCMPVYGAMVFAGMTEVLFALVTMLAVLGMYRERYVQAMVFASFLPFARPEYVAIWPFLLAWVAGRGQWKALPFILTGHVVYAILGGFVFVDPFWVFTRDPYTGAASVYGQGPLLHFTDRIQHIYGAPFMWALALAIVSGFVLALRRGTERGVVAFFTVCALLPAFAIVVVHSVLWWKGLKGSLGLTRVLATGAPLAALFVCVMFVVPARWSSPRRWMTTVLSAVGTLAFICWAFAAFLGEHRLPMHGSPVERVAQRVGEVVRARKGEHGRIVHAPPLVALFAEIDPFDTAAVSHGNDLRQNDLLVWDAAYGPNEGGMPLDGLLKDGGLDLVQVIVPEERWIVLGGSPMEYFLFAKRERARSVSCDRIVHHGHWSVEVKETRCDSVVCDGPAHGSLCLATTEFPLEFRRLEWGMNDLLYAEVFLRGRTTAPLCLVMEQNAALGRISYWTQNIAPGEFNVSFKVPPHGPEIVDKLYFINPDRKNVVLKELDIEVCSTRALRS
ncbi:MAG: DUF2029 domain-containing protein [Flavobacteriales bacterium]|nr:DUF2029 domain-containing protein [Flavobacteriales bacterium]